MSIKCKPIEKGKKYLKTFIFNIVKFENDIKTDIYEVKPCSCIKLPPVYQFNCKIYLSSLVPVPQLCPHTTSPCIFSISSDLALGHATLGHAILAQTQIPVDSRLKFWTRVSCKEGPTWFHCYCSFLISCISHPYVCFLVPFLVLDCGQDHTRRTTCPHPPLLHLLFLTPLLLLSTPSLGLNANAISSKAIP